MATPGTRRISPDKAREWWAYFRSYPGFAQIWSSQGWGTTQIAPLSQKILDASQPPPQIRGEQTALIIPIVERDWSARWVLAGDIVITHGSLWACETSIALFDFAQQQVHSYPYEAFAKVARASDDILLATLHKHPPVRISLRLPRPSSTTPQVGFVLDLVQILASDSVADRELILQRGEREADQYHQKLQNADTFVESVHEFFARIVPSGLDTLEAQPTELAWPISAPPSRPMLAKTHPKSRAAWWVAFALALGTCLVLAFGGLCLFLWVNGDALFGFQ